MERNFNLRLWRTCHTLPNSVLKLIQKSSCGTHTVCHYCGQSGKSLTFVESATKKLSRKFCISKHLTASKQMINALIWLLLSQRYKNWVNVVNNVARRRNEKTARFRKHCETECMIFCACRTCGCFHVLRWELRE